MCCSLFYVQNYEIKKSPLSHRNVFPSHNKGFYPNMFLLAHNYDCYVIFYLNWGAQASITRKTIRSYIIFIFEYKSKFAAVHVMIFFPPAMENGYYITYCKEVRNSSMVTTLL